MNPMSEKEFQDYLRQSNWQMRAQIDQNQKDFQLGSYLRFDWDPWRGELVFSSGGTPKVVARIQIVGSLSTKSNSWVWAWATPGLFDAVRKAVLQTKRFGEERGIISLITPKWAAKESDAWEMTAITARLSDAKGAYKCPSPDGFTFMVFTDLRSVSDRKRIFGVQACSHVLEEDQPILLVSRELDGEVLAVCGGENDSAATTKSIPLAQLLDLDPTLGLLADMPDGWVAMRDAADQDWVRSKAE
ncbi:MAG TPA: hypothetical protein VKW04_03560 [Planctomycetota bacterium]|nr:hypothetical protein [Planctomycetota bacterium]